MKGQLWLLVLFIDCRKIVLVLCQRVCGVHACSIIVFMVAIVYAVWFCFLHCLVSCVM